MRKTTMPEVKVELYWTIKDVAERLHAGQSTVKRWMAIGRLKRTKAGDKTLISESDIQQFLKDCSEAA